MPIKREVVDDDHPDQYKITCRVVSRAAA